MKEIKFVNAKDVKTIEEYGASLLTSLISLKTLELYQVEAFKKGILDQDETETSKSICWEIQRLISLYKAQIQHVLDRTEIKEDEILTYLKQQMPDVKIPRKKKVENATKSS